MFCQVVTQPPSLQTMARNLRGLLGWHSKKSLRLPQLCPNKHHLNYQRTSWTSLNATLFSSTVERVMTNLSIAPDYLCSVKCRGRLTTFHPYRAALEEHTRRSIYQGGLIWGHCLEKCPDIATASDWGWEVDGSKFKPKWTVLPIAEREPAWSSFHANA